MRGARVLTSLLVVAALDLGGSSIARAQPKAGPPTLSQPEAPPAPKSPEEQRYDQHFENGIQLYDNHDWLGAVTEFEAAYAAVERAEPLINQALSHKELGKYPKAVALLELALSKHATTMSPTDIEAAQREIAKMRALFGFIDVARTTKEASI